ncbi:DUF6246 family protein [Rodentibacter caecimuris]|uniref:DUF6246 family protein n=2 Tax=Rodentibacter caecimuris TaxID=1796644 RepID=UPI000AABCF6F|nr:DUF6246 family protein [Rodentibacter heylii]
MMKPITNIGECLISTAERDYFFKPSLKAMAVLGSPVEIVQIYAELHGSEVRALLDKVGAKSTALQEYALDVIHSPVFGRKILQHAMNVLCACCEDDVSRLIGEWKSGTHGLVYVRGTLPYPDIITIARFLMMHGVIGCCPLDVPANKSAGSYSSEFQAVEYISIARTAFGLSRQDAENLTMTEFQQLIKSQQPQKKSRHFTDDEYDRIMAEYEQSRLSEG